MYKEVWKFEVSSEFRDRFENAYGPTGRWSELFRKAKGYRGTELLRSVDSPVYLTVDSWDSSRDFETFKQSYKAEYDVLDRECEALTRTESRIGSFETL